MSLDEIRSSIEHEGKSRAGSILEEGAAAAAATLKEAKARAFEILSSAKAEAEKEAERIKRERLSAAQMEATSLLVAAREAVLERQMGHIEKEIVSRLAGKKLESILFSAAKQLARSTQDHVVVRTGKSYLPMAKKVDRKPIVGKEGELSVETKDGSISIDVSPRGLVSRNYAAARSMLASELWKVKD